jgi:hypothetical protein
MQKHGKCIFQVFGDDASAVKKGNSELSQTPEAGSALSRQEAPRGERAASPGGDVNEVEVFARQLHPREQHRGERRRESGGRFASGAG